MRLKTWLNVRLSRFTYSVREDFDADYYRAENLDLETLSDRRLAVHYEMWGRAEKRYPNAKAKIAAAEAASGDLEDSFDPAEYLLANEDVRRLGLSPHQATLHYLEHGRSEGRSARVFNPAVYRELYFPKEQISDEALRRNFEDAGCQMGRVGSAAAYLAAQGRTDGRWADAIDLDAFALLNWGWAGEVTGHLDAVRVMLDEGVRRLAPLSFDLKFDPAYYRDAHPDLAPLDDEALYRRWLFQDFAYRPGSAQQHLRWLRLELASYPDTFDWRAYAAGHRGLRTRWDALDHLVRKGLGERTKPPLRTALSADFLVALSQTLAARDDIHAAVLLEQAAEGGLSDEARQWLGDCYLRLGEWRKAYEAYAEVAGSAGMVVWTVCNGAKAAIEMKQPDLALAMVRQGADRFSGDVNWRSAVHQTIRAEFEHSWSLAEARYLKGERVEGDQIIEKAVESAADRWRELDPLGILLPSDPDGPVVILANVDLAQCTHYRVSQKAQLLETLGRPYAIFGQNEVEDFITALPGAALAIFYRLPATPDNIRAIDTARAIGLPTFYDIDDLIFDPEHYPEPLETYGGSVSPEFYAMLQLGAPLFRAAMARCDYGIASTTALAKHMDRVVRRGKTLVLPNGLDGMNESLLETLPARSRRDGAFVIFYGSGTKAHNSDFLDLAGAALVEVMLRHPHVQLLTAGFLTLDARFDTVRDRIIITDWTNDLRSYWALLAEVDLNIAVLARYPTTEVKSEIKWLEAAALGVPSVVSSTDRYLEVLTPGVDALVAETPEEWAQALERMITDPALRADVVERAREKLALHYTLEANAARFKAVLDFAAAQHPRAAKTKKRVLLVNLFFPPQTIGGSTRVVRDNLDEFLENAAAEDLEFAVLTSDFDAPTPYRLRVEQYKGAPVFRLSTPMHLHMEWRPFNVKIEVMFETLLNLWKPDLVHFHCVQRLTASIVEVCRRRGTPYINTLHDAWWISDWQFLSDDGGRIRKPCEPWPLNGPYGHSPGESIARRTAIQPLLEGSAEVLGVSETFTRIHQACGFAKARSVPNGVPPMPGVVRARSSSGKVRLAHIGSQTRFKGYDLVKAALMQEDFPNLELTVVEHSRFGGVRERAVWGSTPVTFVGKTKQEQMHEFYAGVDVLLAPSLWPESFGLVTREALYAGLWVLASDRGAVGEDVVPGVNGWVIDVTSPGPILEVLTQINADPERFLSSPPQPERPLRRAKDQAEELLQIYADVLRRTEGQTAKVDKSGRSGSSWSLRAKEHPALFSKAIQMADFDS